MLTVQQIAISCTELNTVLLMIYKILNRGSEESYSRIVVSALLQEIIILGLSIGF